MTDFQGRANLASDVIAYRATLLALPCSSAARQRQVKSSQMAGRRGRNWTLLKGVALTSWDLDSGDRIRRKELHDSLGGNRQNGISPSRKSPNVFLFSDPRAAELHGYEDVLSGDVVLYYGEGQQGDQALTHGNRAILNHKEQGRALRLFRGAGPIVEYLGEYEIFEDDPYTWEVATQTGGGPTRKAVVFRLRQID